ncbi:hypothetical protein [Ureibacillus sinduriensis]|uniref:Uncharacterized protein n=1 Tax=Ureibacillus sinduriensis BLB-1 = JCM 15800 TaxID=1384057 RepID=A0A0A3ISZ6_9BACL|nr:hypothetical protein [Ureibacillus sinduriensis]KGR77952.1 hypothetical protein CD33_01885 [Ureibacillus sinduriensis BLB-1 = JCM 15800]
MKKKITGVVFGIVISLITAMLFMLMGQVWAGGITSLWGESWLYFSVIIPFALTFGVLGGYFRNKDNLSNKRLWMISFISAFFITLFSGTIGAIIGETIVRGGMETINVEGTLVWGTVYAFVLLPLTIPFARLIIGVFYKLIKMIPSN